MNKIGGAVLGAFDPKGRMVGFLDWLPAWEGEGRYFYSLAQGVLPGFRDHGLGQAIKQEQRRLALKAGIERIQWTFDPLRVKNAFFNLEKLGAVAHRYIPNHHGELCLNSQAGLATDRLEAVWYLRSRRVKQARGLDGAVEGQGAPARLRSRCPWTYGGWLRSRSDVPVPCNSGCAGSSCAT